MTVISSMFTVLDAAVAGVTLDSCRSMAIRNNKQMHIRTGEIVKARYQQDQAKAAYLPALDFVGGYTYNQRKLSMFDSDQLLPIETFNAETGMYEFDLVKNPVTGQPVTAPDGSPIPETVAFMPKKSFSYDIHNVFFGAVTLTQPVYMGGKIRALNKISGYAEIWPNRCEILRPKTLYIRWMAHIGKLCRCVQKRHLQKVISIFWTLCTKMLMP